MRATDHNPIRRRWVCFPTCAPQCVLLPRPSSCCCYTARAQAHAQRAQRKHANRVVRAPWARADALNLIGPARPRHARFSTAMAALLTLAAQKVSAALVRAAHSAGAASGCALAFFAGSPHACGRAPAPVSVHPLRFRSAPARV